MAQQRLIRQQPVFFIDAQIIRRVGVKLLGKGDLIMVFAEVGLHVALGVLSHQGARHLQLLRG